MYATNPTTSNFSSFVADHISEKAREEGAKEDLSNLDGGIASMKKNLKLLCNFLDMSYLETSEFRRHFCTCEKLNDATRNRFNIHYKL